MKTCLKCFDEKALSEFRLKKNGRHHSWCLPCSQKYAREFAQTPEQKAKRQAWYLENAEKAAAQHKARWASNKALYEPARKKWAAENRGKVLAYFQEKGRDFREWIDSLKSEKPCLDCSETFSPYVMEYDHVRGEKRFNIGKMTNHKTERVLEEISKCDLVCCACHRIRSHSRRKAPTTKKLVEFREWLDILKTHPCKDCNRTLPSVAMDFDHIQDDKKEEISDMWSWSRTRVLEELAKCELVCANCHRERTVTRLRSNPHAFHPMSTLGKSPLGLD